MFHRRTVKAAKGQWRGILTELGVPESALKRRHGPCPMCGGKDRFRWDNAEGRGTYICSQCGAGDGMALAIAFTGREYRDVADQIDVLLGNVKFEHDKPRPQMTDAQRRDALREVYAASAPIQSGDLAATYLESRGVGDTAYPKALRFAAALRDGEGGVRPAMVALVGRYGEAKFDTIHRTFLRPDGKAKAEMAAPRRLMPGNLPDGACVALSEWTGRGVLGIAEGIETALSAARLFEIPVWSALNANMMAKWTPPEGCEEVVIFIDNDANFTGQAAGYRLANRLATKGLPVSVHCPDQIGSDWNDMLVGGRRGGTTGSRK